MLWQAKFPRRSWGGAWEKGVIPLSPPSGSPGFSSSGNTSICMQFTQLTKYSLPLHIACYVLDKTAREGWICPLLMCFFLWVPNPPVWTFWNIRIFPLLCLVYVVHVIFLFPLPPQYFIVLLLCYQLWYFNWWNTLSLVLLGLCWLQKRQDAVWWAWK